MGRFWKSRSRKAAADEKWTVLMEHVIPAGWTPIDPLEADMLFVESELLAAGVEVVFDPRRPGDNFSSRSAALPLKLMVKESDRTQAREIARDIMKTDT
ncbi:MAG: hypothetical protein AB2L09_08295 [Coriobacteriia bacterium]